MHALYGSLVYRASPSSLFFFNDTAPTEIYTLSLHDALPICAFGVDCASWIGFGGSTKPTITAITSLRPRASSSRRSTDRKSTRLNSSHVKISYAVFCLKKKKKNNDKQQQQNE